jgi:hypothetical protein
MCVILVNKDLEFIYSIYQKLNITPPSWYWRVPTECKDHWIERRVKLSIERKMIEGHLLSDKTYIYYTIPLESSFCTVSIGRGSPQNISLVPYEDLYGTLEALFL